MKISVGTAQDSFIAKVNNFTVEGSKERAEAVRTQSRKTYGTRVKALQKVDHTPEIKAIVVPKKPAPSTAKHEKKEW